MHLGVAHRTILEARVAEVVKRRRNSAHAGYVHRRTRSRFRRRRRRIVGVTLQTDEANLVARQHTGIGRAVRLVAGRTPFKTYRGVLKNERPALIAMALKAAWLVSKRGAHRLLTETGMRIMTIGARHGAFRQTMFIGFLERSPH